MASSKAHEYRENAERCEQEATRALTPALADEYLELAKQWRDMAEWAGRGL